MKSRSGPSRPPRGAGEESGTADARERRGRLLFVGPAPLDASIVDRLRQHPVHVRNLFEAIGEVTTSDAGHPIVAVVIDAKVLPESGASAADTLRRLDPSLRVIGLIDGTAPAGAREAFDSVIDAPLVPEALADAIGSEWMTAPAEALSTEETNSHEAMPAQVDALEGAPGDQPMMSVTDRLGDTDLLEAVMNDPQGVTATALALIRQETGWPDLGLLAADDPAPANAAACPVAIGTTLEKRLATSQATTRGFAPWAEWLGRWLTLDAAHRDYRLQALRDDLTGAWNRRYFNRFLDETIAEARQLRRPVTVMVFDIDDFKIYNDDYGHEAGDVILCETVALLNSVIRSCDRVCRVGGDEFAVIFADLDEPRESGSSHPDSVAAIVRRFQAQVGATRFPKLGLEAPGTLSISAGLATFPWDGQDPAALLRHADQRMLESKRKGKNQITFGPGAANIGPEVAGEPAADSTQSES